MKKLYVALPVVPALLALAPSAALAAQSCEGLKSLSSATVEISMAQSVPAGDFTLPGEDGGRAQTFKDLPAFCRIAATLKPSSDSDIKIEVWLPQQNWNGRYEAEGNGGWAGSISYPAMAQALKAGFATSSTDTGHTEANGQFVYGHPEKWKDFAYRSEHEMAVTSKNVIDAFYDPQLQASYWNGCSTGGRQALMALVRYPEDFNGIIAGDPANPRALLGAWQLSMAQKITANKASMLDDDHLKLLHKNTLSQCDAQDGVTDGLISNPQLCHPDLSRLACKGAPDATCLTPAQTGTAEAIMSPGKYSNGKTYWTGFAPGSELGWAGQQKADARVADHYKYVVFNDPNWDYMTLNPDRDIPIAEKAGLDLDITTTDFSAFTKRGGKLITYHGWADPQVPAMSSVMRYKDLMAGTPDAANSIRLYMVPGMLHCRGGDGPNVFDMSSAIDNWVTKGVAPTAIVATHSTNGQVDRTRPLCPYPQVAKYKGTGNSDQAENFVCTAP